MATHGSVLMIMCVTEDRGLVVAAIGRDQVNSLNLPVAAALVTPSTLSPRHLQFIEQVFPPIPAPAMPEPGGAILPQGSVRIGLPGSGDRVFAVARA